jgi:hypothetical protein
MTPNKLSEPIKGTMGIYVVMLESVQKPAAITDVAGEKTKALSNITNRVEGTAAEVLKDAANITDNRAKHF